LDSGDKAGADCGECESAWLRDRFYESLKRQIRPSKISDGHPHPEGVGTAVEISVSAGIGISRRPFQKTEAVRRRVHRTEDESEALSR
jgi:hypothetical protein